jgi:hypothetical protein
MRVDGAVAGLAAVVGMVAGVAAVWLTGDARMGAAALSLYGAFTLVMASYPSRRAVLLRRPAPGRW